ncbi:MAG: ABC transporter permease [Oscillospiraceae bacterium]|nr:ABC transporter permease [Oscillospiraceae bacterium]
MNKVLRKRLFRDLKQNFGRYAALLLLITMGIFLVTSMVGASETIITGTERQKSINMVEDGQFSVFLPLTDDELATVSSGGVEIERMFSLDLEIKEGQKVRMFKNRERIDLIQLDEGRLAETDGEAVLEKRFSEVNGIHIGDVLTAGGHDFIITGTGSVPDYDNMLANLSDTAVQSESFGLIFVTPHQYDSIRDSGSQKAEDYTYAYRLVGAITDDDVKTRIKDLEFDASKVTDRYFRETVDDILDDRKKIEDSIDELCDATAELDDGAKELHDGADELYDGTNRLYDGSAELSDGAKELDSGAHELYNGIIELHDGAVELNDGAKALSEGAADADKGAAALRNGSYELDRGAAELKSGTNELKDGAVALSVGMAELESHSSDLVKGADELFDGYLAAVQQQLDAAGVKLTLTKDNYAQILGALAAADPQAAEAKKSLDSIAEFSAGIKEYTTGVSQAAAGSAQLSQGAAQVYAGADKLKQGTAQLSDGSAALAAGTKELSEGSSALYNGTKELYSGTDELKSGAKELSDGTTELYDGTTELKDGAKELSDGAKELSDGTDELKDGTGEFRDSSDTLKNDMDELLDRVFEIDIENLTSFIKQSDNIRINAAASDVVLNKMAGLVTGVILLILLAYVISVFIVHQIEKESGVIGALYAMGVKKRDLVSHYVTLPTILAFVGGIIGFLAALTPFGINDQMKDTYNYFSLPRFGIVYPAYLLVYAFVMPPLISAVVNMLVIDKKLSRTALSLMRNKQSGTSVRQFKVRSKDFRTIFAVRQIVREARSALTVLLGMFFSFMIVLLACNTYTLCRNVSIKNTEDTRYEYMYLYKYPTDEAPAGGEKAYIKNLSTYDTGYNLPVTVIGLDGESRFFDAHPEKSMNKAVINNSIKERLGYKKGDKVTFSDDAAERSYSFTITDICEYSPGFTVFMDRESMCGLFGEEDDYYNAVYSDKALDIEEGRLYSITTKSDIERASGVFIDQMQSLIWTLMIAGTVIFCVVMYLMMGVMIDRSALGISLIKIFGYRSREIRSLYLNGNLLIVAVGGLICLPLAKLVIDRIYPLFISNVACCMDITLSPKLVLMIYAAMLIIYLVINELLVFRVKRITPAEVLRNRE